MPPEAASSKGQSAKWIILALALIVLVTSAIRWPLLNIPFERDEGEYAYIGWRLGHGELPYRDWVDQKPPAIFWVYRLALALPVDPIVAVHFMGLVFAAASACVLYRVGRRFLNPEWAVVAAILFALLSADTRMQGQAANTELFMLLPLLLAQLAFFTVLDGGRRQIGFMLLCGMSTGIASAFKQVAAVNWLFLIALYPVFLPRGKQLSGLLRFAGWSTLGAAVVWALIGLYFSFRNGFADFIYWVFTHNFHYVSNLSWSDRRAFLSNTLAGIYQSQAVVWIVFLGVLAALGYAKRWKWLLFLGGWALTSLLGVVASGYFFPHYFQQLLPALALGAALGAQTLGNSDLWKHRVPASIRTSLLGLCLAVLPVVSLFPFWFKYHSNEAIAKIYPRTLFSKMPELAQRVAAATQADDRIFIFGAEPELYFYAQRISASRYIFLLPLYGRYPDALQNQKAAAEELASHHPAAFISLPIGLLSMEGSEQYFTDWCHPYVTSNFSPHLYVTVNEAAEKINFVTEPADLRPDSEPIVGVVFLRK